MESAAKNSPWPITFARYLSAGIVNASRETLDRRDARSSIALACAGRVETGRTRARADPRKPSPGKNSSCSLKRRGLKFPRRGGSGRRRPAEKKSSGLCGAYRFYARSREAGAKRRRWLLIRKKIESREVSVCARSRPS